MNSIATSPANAGLPLAKVQAIQMELAQMAGALQKLVGQFRH